MNIAFWNLNKKSLSDLLVELVNEQLIDILILAEATDDVILDFIKKQKLVNPKRKFLQISSGKTVLLSIEGSSLIIAKNTSTSPRWSSFQIKIPTIITFNLFSIHFHSKVNWSNDSLSLECVNLARDINILETSSGVNDTVLIGDFNMNPYESGLVAANGLHALPDLNHMSKKVKGRNIDGITYKYFYNPMWNFFGDNQEPFGTYYYREAGHVSKEWNIFDQIIYRPSLAHLIEKDSVKIIYKIGGQKLTTVLKRPDKDKYSDHLPILLNISILNK